MKTKLLSMLTAILLLSSLNLSAQLVVNSTDDGTLAQVKTWAGTGKITLRYAIGVQTADTLIKFDASLFNKTIKLTSGPIGLVKFRIDTLNVNGENNHITIDGDNLSRILNVNDSTQWGANSTSKVTIRNLRFINGSSDFGGAIRNQENLLVQDCIFENNKALIPGTSSSGNLYSSGGAIFQEFSEAGFLTVDRCIFDNNQSVHGGAISVDMQHFSNAKITNSTFKNNSATWDGGAVHGYWASNVTIFSCTFVGNTTNANNGPAIHMGQNNFTFGSCLFVNNPTYTVGVFEDIHTNALQSFTNQGYNVYTADNAAIWISTDKKLSNPSAVLTLDNSVGGYTLTSTGDVDTRIVIPDLLDAFEVGADITGTLRANKTLYNSGAKEFKVASAIPAVLTTKFNPRIQDNNLILSKVASKITIYSISGSKLIEVSNIQNVNLSKLNAGIYLLNINNDGVLKIVKN